MDAHVQDNDERTVDSPGPTGPDRSKTMIGILFGVIGILLGICIWWQKDSVNLWRAVPFGLLILIGLSAIVFMQKKNVTHPSRFDRNDLQMDLFLMVLTALTIFMFMPLEAITKLQHSIGVFTTDPAAAKSSNLLPAPEASVWDDGDSDVVNLPGEVDVDDKDTKPVKPKQWIVHLIIPNTETQTSIPKNRNLKQSKIWAETESGETEKKRLGKPGTPPKLKKDAQAAKP